MSILPKIRQATFEAIGNSLESMSETGNTIQEDTGFAALNFLNGMFYGFMTKGLVPEFTKKHPKITTGLLASINTISIYIATQTLSSEGDFVRPLLLGTAAFVTGTYSGTKINDSIRGTYDPSEPVHLSKNMKRYFKKE
jgi:hypothetical protein